MVSPDLTACQALLALNLGAFVAEYRYRFQLYALKTQSEVEVDLERPAGYRRLTELLDEIHTAVNSINSDPVMGHVPVKRLKWSCAYEVAKRSLDKFFGTDDGMSDDWHAIVRTYTSLLDHEEHITDRGYRRASGQLAREISQHVPEFVLRAEDVGKNLPEPQCSFFLLGNSLLNCHFYLDQLFSRSEWQDRQEGDPIFRYLTRKQKAIESLYRNCAPLLPHAGLEVPANLELVGLRKYLLGQYESIRDYLEREPASLKTVESEPEVAGVGVNREQPQSVKTSEHRATALNQNESLLQTPGFGITAKHPEVPPNASPCPPPESAPDAVKDAEAQVAIEPENLGTDSEITLKAKNVVPRENTFKIDKLTIYVKKERKEILWRGENGKESLPLTFTDSNWNLLIALLNHHDDNNPPSPNLLESELGISNSALSSAMYRLRRFLKDKCKVMMLPKRETRLCEVPVADSD